MVLDWTAAIAVRVVVQPQAPRRSGHIRSINNCLSVIIAKFGWYLVSVNCIKSFSLEIAEIAYIGDVVIIKKKHSKNIRVSMQFMDTLLNLIFHEIIPITPKRVSYFIIMLFVQYSSEYLRCFALRYSFYVPATAGSCRCLKSYFLSYDYFPSY